MGSTTTNRVTSLDGLRGLAMILVFLTHVNPVFLLSSFPFLDTMGLFGSGVTGVTFLFILSGFLMSYLYPSPRSSLQFIQKRYTRIFPLFLTMSCVMFIFYLLPQLSPFLRFGTILAVGLFSSVVWVYGVQKINKVVFSRILFLLFLLLQILIGALYIFWIGRHPPSYLQHLPLIKNLFVGLTNATLTFPLGNYFPMLDGVYWSLASEILFYILYPTLLVPIILFLQPQKRYVKILFLLSLLPLLVGVDILSHHIFVLSALQPGLFFYFATGITLGYLYRVHQQRLFAVTNYFHGWLAIVPFLLLIGDITLQHILNSIFPDAITLWFHLLFAFPSTFLVAILLNKQLLFSKVFASKIVVYIGMVSYSIYLSHAAIIHIAEQVFHVTDALSNTIAIIASFGIAVLVASILYFLLERPYFSHRLQEKQLHKISKAVSYAKGKFVLAGITGIYILAIFFAFQSDFNFFSLISKEPAGSIISAYKASNNILSFSQYPTVHMQITAKQNNLGIIAIRISQVKKRELTQTPMLVATLTQKGNSTPIATTSYVLDEFRGNPFPFGFPTQTDSQNKIYLLTLSLVPASAEDYVTIDTQSIASVYQLGKGDIIKHPQQLFQLVVSKLENVYTTTAAKLTLLLGIPFFALVLYVVGRKNYFVPSSQEER